MMIRLFTQHKGVRENTSFSVDSGALIEDMAPDGAGVFIVNDGGMPVSGALTDSIIHGGKYGIYTATDPGSLTHPGASALTLNHSRVSGESGVAIRVDKGATLNVALENGTQLLGGNATLASVGKNSHLSLSVADSALKGNLLNNEGGTVNVTLEQGGSLSGTMQNITGLTVKNSALWQLTGSSSTGNLSSGGTVSLASGSTAGHVSTINANYTGNNGNLLFSTQLAGDTSLTDKLVVNGNTSGTTRVAVMNAGGTGAMTQNGIELIQVSGNSGGNFTQSGRIVAGAYDYNLMKRGNNWYLDSHLTHPGPAPTPDVYVVRPEAGTYVANQAAASSMFLASLHSRAGENCYMNDLNADGEVSSLWLRQVGDHNQFHDSSGQLKTTGNAYVAQLGGDLAQWSRASQDSFHLGVMAGYGNNKNNTQSSVTGHSSKGAVDGYSVGLYSTWYQSDADKIGAYVDSQLMYNWFNNRVNGDAVAPQSYRSKGLTASVEAGYTLAVGQFGARDNPVRTFMEPQAQVTWMGVKADDLTERNGTRVSIQGNNNIQTRLGVRAFMQGHSNIDSGKSRTFQPFVEVNWLHNTKRNGVTMNGVSLEQAGATNLGELRLGVEGQIAKHTQIWGSIEQLLGSNNYSNTAAMVGVKYSF